MPHNPTPHPRTIKATSFSSFTEENIAEYARRARMTVAERFAEFAVIQERAFGKAWTEAPIERIATMEKLDW